MDDDLTQVNLVWLKSSHSGGNSGGNCVEVAGAGDLRAVRDSKDPNGPMLRFGATAWALFVAEIKR